eukprot:6616619-Prymnesium_polylepis.3
MVRGSPARRPSGARATELREYVRRGKKGTLFSFVHCGGSGGFRGRAGLPGFVRKVIPRFHWARVTCLPSGGDPEETEVVEKAARQKSLRHIRCTSPPGRARARARVSNRGLSRPVLAYYSLRVTQACEAMVSRSLKTVPIP